MYNFKIMIMPLYNFSSKPVCLQEAKKNLDKLYLFVGISENIPGFLLVMETLLPQFFHDALKEYVNMCKSQFNHHIDTYIVFLCNVFYFL